MTDNNRTYNSARNIVYGLINQIIILVLGFVSRAMFLQFLNETYLGINSLFTEVLSMLSLADLGLGTVMVYTFYKPLADNDNKKVCALLGFYKHLYRIIASAVGCIGLILIPFLHLIVNTSYPLDNLYLYYLLFLFKTVISYLFVYKVSILNADQKNYLVSKISTYTRILTVICQIVILYITKNYILYLLIDIIATWLNNYLCARKADELYPYFREEDSLNKAEKKEIFANIGSGFLYKLSSVLLNSTDNTLISIILSTEIVGFYSNYGMIFSRLSLFVNILFSSLSGSIGNLVVTSDKEHRYSIFSIVQVISFMISAITSICCFILMGDFITLWLGSRYAFGIDVLFACVFNFYFSISLQPLWIYRDATGLYKKTKYVMMCTAIINLVLSIVLGLIYGLAGIIIASIISRLVTYFWYEPCILYKQYFGRSVYSYFVKHVFNFVITMLLCFVGYVLFSKMETPNFGWFAIKGVLVGMYACTGMVVFYFWQKDFKATVRYFVNKIK